MKISKVVIVLLLILNASAIFSQSNLNFGDRFILGSSITYITDKNEGVDNRHHELTWHNNVAVNLNKSWYAGLSYLRVHTSGSSYTLSPDLPKDNFNLVGVFTQYDFIPETKDRLFAEVSFQMGDYCTCGDEDPYKDDGLRYLGFGGGVDFQIYKNLSLDLGFMFQHILNRRDGKFNYNVYVVGLNYDLIRKK